VRFYLEDSALRNEREVSPSFLIQRAQRKDLRNGQQHNSATHSKAET